MKFKTSKEDIEDYEQEKRIRDFLKNNKIRNSGIEFQYINSKGNARSSNVKASFSLDQKVNAESNSSYSDIIAGHDGRTLENGHINVFDPEKELSNILEAIGLEKGLKKWTEKILQSSLVETKTWKLLKKSLRDLG